MIKRLTTVPVGFFAIVLGVIGLGTSWREATRLWGPPGWIGEFITAAGVRGVGGVVLRRGDRLDGGARVDHGPALLSCAGAGGAAARHDGDPARARGGRLRRLPGRDRRSTGPVRADPARLRHPADAA